MNAHYQKSQKEKGLFSLVFKKYFICIFTFILFSLLFTALIGILFFNSNDPTSKIDIASYVSLFISTSVSSFILSKSFKDRNALHGLIFGIMLAIITFLISIALNNDKDAIEILLSKGLMVLISFFMSILGKPKQKRKRKYNT